MASRIPEDDYFFSKSLVDRNVLAIVRPALQALLCEQAGQ
jgi:hypothetical protein